MSTLFLFPFFELHMRQHRIIFSFLWPYNGIIASNDNPFGEYSVFSIVILHVQYEHSSVLAINTSHNSLYETVWKSGISFTNNLLLPGDLYNNIGRFADAI